MSSRIGTTISVAPLIARTGASENITQETVKTVSKSVTNIFERAQNELW